METLSAFEREIGSRLANLLSTADGVITLLMAVGAVFGALNIMYANVARRRTEIATFRALGGALTEFTFTVTPATIFIGLFLTLTMGFVGGLFPAVRAARLPLATALRDG